MAAAGNATAGNASIVAVSVSAAAGSLLARVAEAGGAVTLRAPRLPRVDVPSAVAIWAMAVGTLAAGSLWSAAQLRAHLTGSRRQAQQVRGGALRGDGAFCPRGRACKVFCMHLGARGFLGA